MTMMRVQCTTISARGMKDQTKASESAKSIGSGDERQRGRESEMERGKREIEKRQREKRCTQTSEHKKGYIHREKKRN